MRINVYSQELTDEVNRFEKLSNTGADLQRRPVHAALVSDASPPAPG